MTLVRALERFAAGAPEVKTGPRCELCGEAIGAGHAHLVDVESRALRCACRACALLFANPGAAGGRYRAVPERYQHDPSFTLGEADWAALQIPVRIAFFFFNSSLDRWVAFYPSPAGATESLLDLDAWRELAATIPLARDLAPDVEALLVSGRPGERCRCFVVPVFACYELVGRVRLRWKGFDGGEEARREIDGFFEGLRARCAPLAPEDA